MVSRLGFLTIAALGVLATVSVQAAEDIPKEGGFSGYVIFGPGGMSAETNVVGGNVLADIGTEEVDSIMSSPTEAKSTAFLLVAGEVRYTLQGRPMQFFFGAALEDLVTMMFSDGLGFRWQPGKSGIYQIGLLSNLPAKIWEDPYVAGEPREETEQSALGLRFDWAKILGSGLEVMISQRKLDVGDEASGTWLGLSAADRELLRRDGDRLDLAVSYDVSFAKHHRIEPKVILWKEDRDGKAVSNDWTALQLNYAYMGQPFSVVGSVLAGKRSFDEANPIYGIKQDSRVKAVSATVLYQLPTSSRRWSLVGNVSLAKENSDIDFHDTVLKAFALGARYRFD